MNPMYIRINNDKCLRSVDCLYCKLLIICGTINVQKCLVLCGSVRLRLFQHTHSTLVSIIISVAYIIIDIFFEDEL